MTGTRNLRRTGYSTSKEAKPKIRNDVATQKMGHLVFSLPVKYAVETKVVQKSSRMVAALDDDPGAVLDCQLMGFRAVPAEALTSLDDIFFDTERLSGLSGGPAVRRRHILAEESLLPRDNPGIQGDVRHVSSV